jgi:predicted transcriptional regulator
MQIKDLPNLYLQSPRLNQLNILREVASNQRITQAELAKSCSLSVAMVNNYMKDLCSSGFLEYHRKTVKTVTYHLTASGTKQLEALQLKLIEDMVDMFTAAKEYLRGRIMSQSLGVLRRVVLFGTGHLAQLTFHALEPAGVSVLGICNNDIEIIGADFCGRQVLSPSQINFLSPDAVIVADLTRTEEICRILGSLLNRTISVIRLDSQVSQNNAGNLEANSPLTIRDKTVAENRLSLFSSALDGRHE